MQQEKIIIPETVKGLPVTVIPDKAFLSNKTVREIVLPDCLEAIGNWAFAHAENLQTLIVPAKEITIGKDIFRGCKRLQAVIPKGESRELGHMLLKVLTMFKAPQLFAPQRAGEREWLREWDGRLLFFLKQADEEGFSPICAGGEEDYDGDENNPLVYAHERRMEKARLAYFRLRSAKGLLPETKEALGSYLREHTKGVGGAGEEAWQALLADYANDPVVWRIFVEAGGFRQDNAEALLADLEEAQVELKAYLMQEWESRFRSGTFWETLDW